MEELKLYCKALEAEVTRLECFDNCPLVISDPDGGNCNCIRENLMPYGYDGGDHFWDVQEGIRGVIEK